MKRTAGITVISLALGWLTIAGFGNAWVILTGKWDIMPPILGLIALAYGIAALVTALGLWRMRKWSVVAIRIWMVTCLLTLIFFTVSFSEIIRGGYFGAFAFSIFIGFLLWLLDRYVSSELNNVT